MTTESNDRPRDAGLRILGGVMLVALGAAVVVTVVGALLGGSPGAAGAAAGAFSVALVMGFGTYVVHVVAKAVPALSLMMALMTYVLQIVMVGAFFLVLVRSGDLGDSVDGPWLVAGVVVASLTWSAAQIWLSSRARIPMYDLSRSQVSQGQEASEG
ncbi:hypothetical protein [Nocardioides daphniae]|uniref:ATP synthase protein I n=1 Tax=Nocardioides daphniae TaxID=402297 RepID=A0A4P7UDW0_9ACTN|nr:hypothetical protein [Nocardioides daphniae]QCC77711.1 hypothetical protein E2C04_11935 [Nocardioides daphniae]GGD29167.1 hypothetical protein GCM10007231_30870 [Nocardioides daphniae]